MMVGAHRSSGGIAVSGTERSCYAVDVGRGAFGCASAPFRIVTCSGDAIVGSFT